MEEVRLIEIWSSIYCHRIIWALKLKGVSYIHTEDIANKSDDLKRYNPVYQSIPVFVHNRKPIAESIIILEYIEDVWPQHPLLPDDPYEKANARFWAKFLEDKKPTFYAYFRAIGEEQEKLAKEAKEVLQILEEKGLGEKQFFGGNQLGFTDICTGWIACSLELMQEAAGIKILKSDNSPSYMLGVRELRRFQRSKTTCLIKLRCSPTSKSYERGWLAVIEANFRLLIKSNAENIKLGQSEESQKRKTIIADSQCTRLQPNGKQSERQSTEGRRLNISNHL